MKTFARWLLAAGMMFAGLSHLFWARKEFQAQVPDVVTDVLPIDKDGVVVASGAVEIMLGAALVVLPKERRRVGALLAAFFIAIFPGNIAQARGSASGLRSGQRCRSSDAPALPAAAGRLGAARDPRLRRAGADAAASTPASAHQALSAGPAPARFPSR